MHTWLTARIQGARPGPAIGYDGVHGLSPELEPALAPALPPTLQHASNPMAHFVKWCKARFLLGYKQFSVLQQDSSDGRSDTEELLLAGQPQRHDSRAPSPGPGPGHSPAPSGGVRDRERTPSQERAARRERLPSPERPAPACAQEQGGQGQAGGQGQGGPGPQPSPTNRHLNFDEFECDVSVEGGVDEAGQERQEFSFTLYDFDGHGKITKDDITGLVSTIYDTLGASIKVPHYGSKTIKVKLTVSPDKRAAMGAAGAPGAANPTYVNGVPDRAAAEQADNEPATTPPTRVRFKRDLNVTIQERRPPRPRRTSSASVRRRPSAASAPPPPPPPPPQREREPSEDRGYVVHSCSSSCRSGAGSEGGDAEVDGSADEDDIEDEEDEDVPRRTCPATGLSPASVAAAAVATVASAAANVAASGCQSPHAKKRSSSMQRQELLQIIQANMEKMAKKSCSERTGLEERRHSHSGVHPHRHRHRQKQKAAPPMSLSASNSPQRIYDYATTPYYVNLADKGENTTGDADTYRYVVCTPPKHQPMYHNLPCRDRGHNRSRSHDLTTSANTHAHQHSHNHSHSHNPAAPLFRYTLLQEDNTSSVQAFNVRPAKSPAANRRSRAPPPLLPAAAAGHTSSPHHLKHRNREQDQARAMAQVVQWLEQEFSASLNTRTTAGVQEVLINAKAHRTKSKSAAFSSPTDPPPSSTANPPHNVSGNTPRPTTHEEESAPSAGGGGVKQHEHHHVHEHIHHHYHHYQDTPPVLV